MSRVHPKEAQPWLRYLVLPFLLIFFGLVVSYALLSQQPTAPSRPILPASPTPTPTPTSSKYLCPANGWINCMPILTKESAKLCTSEAVAWYQANCPNFQGVAY